MKGPGENPGPFVNSFTMKTKNGLHGVPVQAILSVGLKRGLFARLDLFCECSEVQLDDLGIVRQFASCARVSVLALI